jgi:hypothetical protein
MPRSQRDVRDFDQFSFESYERERLIFRFDEASLNSTETSVNTIASSVSIRTMTNGSNTSNANGVPIPRVGGSTGIYEDHPGLNPTDEMVVEYQAGIREQMSELMRMDGEHPEVVAAAERVHGESDNIAFLQGQLEDLRAHGRESEAFKYGVSNDADLPGGGNPAGSSGGVDLANGNEAGSSAGVDLMNVDDAAGFAAESPLDQFGIHPILDLNIGEYYVSHSQIYPCLCYSLSVWSYFWCCQCFFVH